MLFNKNNFETNKSPISNRNIIKRTSSESLFEDIGLSKTEVIAKDDDSDDEINENLLYWMQEWIVTHWLNFRLSGDFPQRLSR